jgi:hypothetical protein
MESAISRIRRDQGPLAARPLEVPATPAAEVSQSSVVERVRAGTPARGTSNHENPLALLECGDYDSGGAALDARRRRRLE